MLRWAASTQDGVREAQQRDGEEEILPGFGGSSSALASAETRETRCDAVLEGLHGGKTREASGVFFPFSLKVLSGERWDHVGIDRANRHHCLVVSVGLEGRGYGFR